MFAVAGLVAFIIAALLELIKQHENVVIWLVIAGGILVCIEVLWGWRRGGYYRHGV